MRYVLLEVHFFSPYSSNPPLAEFGRGVPLPPPSTLIGALAAAYYYPVERYGVGRDVAEKVVYAAFWAPPYFSVKNISRYFTGFSQKKKRLEVASAAVRAVANGVDRELGRFFRNYANVAHVEAVLKLFGPEALAKAATQVVFTPAVKLETYFAGPGYVLYVLTDDALADAAKYVFRIGQKECIVAARWEAAAPRRLGRKVVSTRFYMPRDAAVGYTGGAEVYMYDRPVADPLAAEPRRYIVPQPAGFIEAELADGWAAVEVEAFGRRLELALPEYAAPWS